jgi:hypothetical protein
MKRFLYITTLLLAASCNWLAITPENTIDEDDLFTTGYGCRNALNGIYLEIGSSDLYGENLSWGFLSAVGQEYLTDNSYVGSYSMQLSKDAANFVYNSATTQTVIQSIWERQYSIIANLNKIIEHIDQVDKNEFAYGEEERNLIKAEAYALRAMLHFDLLRLFAPAPSTNPSGTYIPYREKFGPEMGENLSVTSFIEKCLKDISVAEPLLKYFDTEFHPEAMYASMMNSVTPTWNSRYRFDCKTYIDEMGEFFWFRGWRMNYMSVLALKSRICMYAGGTYKTLARAAAKSLYDEFYTQRGWIGFNAPDEITCNSDLRHFKLATDVMFAAYNKNLATDYDAGLYGSDNNVRYPLANVETLFATDNTGLYSDYRFVYTLKSTNAVNKAYYAGKWSVSAEAVVEAIENPMIPLFRFSEICYTLAELSAENGKYDEAIQYLTDVRKARGADRSITASSKEEVINEIVSEVRKDMMTEGQVFFLYKRLNMPKIPSSTHPGTEMQMSAVNYVLPIPTSESPF